MAPGEAARYLAAFQHAGGLRSALLMGLRTLVFLAFCGVALVLGRSAGGSAQKAEAASHRSPGTSASPNLRS